MRAWEPYAERIAGCRYGLMRDPEKQVRESTLYPSNA